MKNSFSYIAFLLLASFALSSCDLSQEITIDLPEYESEVMVESYLEPGQPFTLLLTQTVGYFDDLKLIYVKDATVTISYDGKTDTLRAIEVPFTTPGLDLLLDTAVLNRVRQFLGESIYLYGSLTFIPPLYDSPFVLNVKTPDGTELTATTYIPKPIEFEDPVIRFNDRDQALILTQFYDDGAQKNFYRRVLDVREQEITQNGDGTSDTTWVTDNQQDFILDDELSNGELLVFGTTYDYAEGDTLIQTIFSITEDYYDYVTSRDAAIAASLSPFGQPAILRSNVTGGQGIFTGQSSVREQVIIKK